MGNAPLLMIPGPIEISQGVRAAVAVAPPSHVAPSFIEDFGSALEAMRTVWCAGFDAQPFVVAGGGTLAMESAVCNLVDPGERAVVVNSGYFGDRMGEMLTRRGAEVVHVRCEPGDVPDHAEILAALDAAPTKAVFVTHVDTSTGVRVDPEPIARAARERGILSVFDGVCATAGETFLFDEWEADVYLTASQKAIGLPAGLALWVVSPRAIEARDALQTPPPLTLDWEAWQPIMAAYLARKPSYFSTPATTMVAALKVGLGEILAGGDAQSPAMSARVAMHARNATAMRAAWHSLGLTPLPTHPDHMAHTLSALYYPKDVDSSVLGLIKEEGAIVAGGLHPALKTQYFRVGHMGDVLTRPADVLRTVRAVATGLSRAGHPANVDDAVAAARQVLEQA